MVLATVVVVALMLTLLWRFQRPSKGPELPTKTAPAAKPPTLRRITFAQFGDFFLYAPLYVAIDGGFFRKRGLDVSIVNTGGDDKTWAAVISDSAQFGVADPTFVAVSAERGQKGLVIASLVNGVPFWGITYRDIAPIADAKSLRPYSVATFPSPSTAFALQSKMFADAGLRPNIRQGAFGAIIPMLKSGAADIGLELEPNVSQATNDGARVVFSLAERYGDFAITGITTTEQLAARDPQLLSNVRSALQEALDLLHQDRAAALRLLQRRFPDVPPQVASAALQRVTAENVIPRSTTITKEAWDKAIQLRIDVGDLRSPAPYEKFVLTSGQPGAR
jgi:NitT/TauT family transport system substrate-binding protein